MNTNIYKRLSSLLCLACFLCVGCQKTNETTNENPQIPPIAQPIQPNLAPTETQPRPPQASNDIWDTSDVDVSKISKEKRIAFSFDDAPSRTLENILAVYAAYNESHPDCPASATIFCNGKYINAQSPPLLATAYAMGFELGNHTHSHHDLTTLTEEQLRWEIDATDELLYTIDGKERHLLRAPFGKINDTVKSIVSTPLIDWTIDTLDWTGKSEDEIYRNVMENKFSGAIVLMHDGYPHTVSALKRLLPDLEKEGYQVVSISQLAKIHHCSLKKGKVYIRARKQS